MKPEYENTYSFTLILPAAELDRRGTIYLDAPRLKLELPLRALNSAQVRSLSRRVQEQASVQVTVEESVGADAVYLGRQLPAGWMAGGPVYRLGATLSSSGQQQELVYLNEGVTVTTRVDLTQSNLQPHLHHYNSATGSWIPAGYFTSWTGEARLDRFGFWAVLNRR
jgi:hypothetical protein